MVKLLQRLILVSQSVVRRHPGKAGGLRLFGGMRTISQFLTPVDKLVVCQRVLFTVGDAGQAGGLPLNYLLPPEMLTLDAAHTDFSLRKMRESVCPSGALEYSC